jgi:hypothetical protein
MVRLMIASPMRSGNVLCHTPNWPDALAQEPRLGIRMNHKVMLHVTGLRFHYTRAETGILRGWRFLLWEWTQESSRSKNISGEGV